MTFKDEFKALLEELVLPEVDALKSGVAELKEEIEATGQKANEVEKKFDEVFSLLDETLSEVKGLLDKTDKDGRS